MPGQVACLGELMVADRAGVWLVSSVDTVVLVK